jgi:transcription-repair coupling factor (superfamily II helicase)
MKEKQTRNGLRLLLTFDNVKSIDRALDLLQPLEHKETIEAS